ncbi:MAG: hypothetical protein K2Y29_08375 [Beijerinckiaceae bacterium]|nr:hypothetical protein [Beijerinckiaceae bacterium]
MEHRYKMHDKVELNRIASSERAGGFNVYEIIRLMPADVSGEYSYRVKAGSTERAVKESEIRRLTNEDEIASEGLSVGARNH